MEENAQILTNRENFDNRINQYLSQGYKIKYQDKYRCKLVEKVPYAGIGFFFAFGTLTMIFLIGIAFFIIGFIYWYIKYSTRDKVILELQEN
ncbi:MAG: hypothetical protein LBT66_04335 [Methanobrevibacter sp.]|jgi:hypothetical protein|nr:hypothetical protein [Candidatus Methanovirga meridionalis]